MGLFELLKQWWQVRQYVLPERTMDELKGITKILFIDDRDFEVTQILRNAGWQNTTQIQDIGSLDTAQISDSHIIFIDIRGVGKELKFRDEGLGLISALRRKYPYKKLVVYSAERTGDRFHEGLSAADERLPKNADPFQFQTLVEKFSRDAFSLDECVKRIRNAIQSETGLRVKESEIRDKMRRLAVGGDLSESAVSRMFNLTNAGSIASILTVFFSA